MPPIRIIAPATTANLGPGYDCLGLSLDIWNRLEVELGNHSRDADPVVRITGEGATELARDRDNLVYRSMVFLYEEAGREVPPLTLQCHNDIPLERGLGSSAAAIAGGLVAANALCGNVYSPNELLEMAATIEGHPDNVAAAVLGGLQLVVMEERRLYTIPISVPAELHAVLFVPDTKIPTSEARAVLPSTVAVADAVYNMSRVALLTTGLTTNRFEYLGLATQDRLHQPYRQSLFPAMKLLFKAARDAGALGVFLSGSGSSVLALTHGREMTVAYEMAEAAKQAGVAGRVQVTRPTVQGAHLVNGS